MTGPDRSTNAMNAGSGQRLFSAIQVKDPLTMTIFGGTGDLTHRKLIPALYASYVHGLLPDQFAIVGVGRRDYDDKSYREWMAGSVREFSRVQVDEGELAVFLARLFYHQGDLSDEASYTALRDRLASGDIFPTNHLFYLSVAPTLFDTVLSRLHAVGMISVPHQVPWTRVVVEKPFGHDLASAEALNQLVSGYLDESQIYRIDHYLGKETVQNILSFRFANAIFEPIFNSRYVHHVQITASETVGMEKGRGAYFDKSGSLRDMVQNHLLQLLCLVAMEPPSSMTANAIRNEKLKVLESVSPLSGAAIQEKVVRAQYTEGAVGEEKLPGYLQEDRVPPGSVTESYVAMQLAINNWRWSGVPFLLRTGKRLRRRCTEICVQFKQPPHRLFQMVECEGDVCDLTLSQSNVLIFRLQPDEGITLQFSAKRPVMQMVVESVEMDFSYSDAWERSLPDAYERLLLDVMHGDSTLFTRADEVEAAWRLIDPLLSSQSAPVSYEAGSWGPREADQLIQSIGANWFSVG